jgi:TolA-binding protein
MPHARSIHGSLRPPRRLGALAGGLLACLALAGCAALGSLFAPEPPPAPAAPDPALENAARDAEIYRQAQLEQIHALEREVKRLRGELREADGAMVSIESGLRGAQTRADAVSALAEARISVERARTKAPWRRAELAELTDKLEEAERQFQSGNPGSAVFFASRAQRVADALAEEARRSANAKGTRRITAPRANLRAGPSTGEAVLLVLGQSTPVLPQRSDGEWVLVRTPDGEAGWVHASLLESR